MTPIHRGPSMDQVHKRSGTTDAAVLGELARTVITWAEDTCTCFRAVNSWSRPRLPQAHWRCGAGGAYQPIPGTVVFVGYGNNLSELVSFRFLTLTRTADSFFMKFSSLFRM